MDDLNKELFSDKIHDTYYRHFFLCSRCVHIEVEMKGEEYEKQTPIYRCDSIPCGEFYDQKEFEEQTIPPNCPLKFEHIMLGKKLSRIKQIEDMEDELIAQWEMEDVQRRRREYR